jgi:hypothetical protein
MNTGMNARRADPFFQVPQTTATTSLGPAELPALYYDVSTLTALFTVEAERAAAQLAPLELKPGLHWGGKAVVGLAFYEYRDTSLGPYNEVGLAIAALPCHESVALGGWPQLWSRLGTRRLGFYILNLPVTTEAANVGGREIYGYPKFVTEIPFKLEGGAFSAAVLDPRGREPILTFNGRLGIGVPSTPLSLVLYSVLNGARLRTEVDVRGGTRLRGKGELRLCVGGSDHVMARNLRELGLHDRQPFLVMDTHRFQSRLNAPVEFDWAARR